jgi:hypothetical protein
MYAFSGFAVSESEDPSHIAFLRYQRRSKKEELTCQLVFVVSVAINNMQVSIIRDTVYNRIPTEPGYFAGFWLLQIINKATLGYRILLSTSVVCCDPITYTNFGFLPLYSFSNSFSYNATQSKTPRRPDNKIISSRVTSGMSCDENKNEKD